ncbi:formylglycine-generating enzyme family protein [Verrucomicrobiota bacterium]
MLKTNKNTVFIVLIAGVIFTSTVFGADQLASFRQIYDKSLKEIQTEYAGNEKHCADCYIKALQNLKVKAQKAGELETIMAADKEQKRFEADREVSTKDLIDGFPEIKSLQIMCRDSRRKCSFTRDQQILFLNKKYIGRLTGMKRDLTKAEKIDEALKVQAEIKRVEASPETTAAVFRVAEYETLEKILGECKAALQGARTLAGQLKQSKAKGLKAKKLKEDAEDTLKRLSSLNVSDLTTSDRDQVAQYKQQITALQKKLDLDVSLDLGSGVKMEFVWIKALNCWVGKYEVTNEEYKRFKSDHDMGSLQGHSRNGDRQPVSNIFDERAADYIRWINAKCAEQLYGLYEIRLPTPKEWQAYAQCGDNRKYPWGDDMPPKYGNYRDETSNEGLMENRAASGYRDGYVLTCPVEKSGKNEWGLYGVSGNVSEITSELCGEKYFACGSSHQDPWNNSTRVVCSFCHQLGARSTHSALGFRLLLVPE